MSNPMLIKDFRILMRDRLIYSFSLVYVIIIGSVIFGMLFFASIGKKPLSTSYSENIAIIFFVFIALLICSLSSGLGVRLLFYDMQKPNINMIKITLLKPDQIIFGKVLALIAYMLLLMLLSVPLLFIIMPISGITHLDIAKCYLVIFISAITFGIIGLMFSSIFSRIKTSASLTYITASIFALGTILIPLILIKIFNIKMPQSVLRLTNIISPFITIISIIKEQYLIFNFSAWIIMIFVYIAISTIALAISLIRLRIILR